MIGFIIATFVISIPSIGIAAKSDFYLDIEKSSSAMLAPVLVNSEGLMTASVEHLRNVLFRSRSIPEICKSGQAKSEFNQSECSKLNSRVWMGVALLFLPFAITFIVILMMGDQIRGFYKKASLRIKTQKEMARGITTDPVETSGDFFSYFHCLKTIQVELPGGQQKRVYLPLESPTPKPGTTLLLYSCGNVFGSQRVIATLHTPHVAVIRGI